MDAWAQFRVDKENEVVCSRELTAKDLKKFRKAVKKDYYFQASITPNKLLKRRKRRLPTQRCCRLLFCH